MRGVWALNVGRGCSHRCAYCYARAYPEAPGSSELHVYENLPERLECELSRLRRRPRAVSLCTATDPFQPFPSLLAVTLRATALLMKSGIPITFLTKGFIPDDFLALFARYPGQVKARIGLLSLDLEYCRTFEPGAAFPEVRLQNIHRLRDAGVSVGVRHDPVIPGVTDRSESLQRVFDALSSEGIAQVDVGYLYVRPGIERLLRGELPLEIAGPLLRRFAGGPVEHVAASPATRLFPAGLRRASFLRIAEIAREHGIRATLCRCKNPDLPEATRCQGSRELAYPAPARKPRQLSLLNAAQLPVQGAVVEQELAG